MPTNSFKSQKALRPGRGKSRILGEDLQMKLVGTETGNGTPERQLKSQRNGNFSPKKK